MGRGQSHRKCSESLTKKATSIYGWVPDGGFRQDGHESVSIVTRPINLDIHGTDEYHFYGQACRGLRLHFWRYRIWSNQYLASHYHMATSFLRQCKLLILPNHCLRRLYSHNVHPSLYGGGHET